MKTKLITTMLLLAVAVPATAETPGLQVPDYSTHILDNGLRIQVMRHATVPMVDLVLWIDAGAIRDPQGQSGLATLTGDALRKGGGDFSAEGFSDAVDFLGATFSTSVGRELVSIRMNVLSKDLERGLELFSSAVLRPSFPEGEIEKLAAQLSEGVAQAKDNPRSVLASYHAAHVFGNHPYGNPIGGTETGLAGIQREDVVDFYEGFYGADRAVLTVAGDVDVEAITARLSKLFGSMPQATQPAPTPVSPVARTGGNDVLLINKVDTPQTWFSIGTLSPPRGDADYAASELVRTIFGGRFTSWLMLKLRTETGLTYSARHALVRGVASGRSSMTTFTATETTKEAIDLALSLLDRLHDEGINAEELESGKAYYKGQTPYEYETAGQLAGAITELAYFNEDRRELDDLFARIDAVTLEDCRRVVKTYFSRDNLTITAIGVASEVHDVLAEYGPVTVRENGDPGFH